MILACSLEDLIWFASIYCCCQCYWSLIYGLKAQPSTASHPDVGSWIYTCVLRTDRNPWDHYITNMNDQDLCSRTICVDASINESVPSWERLLSEISLEAYRPLLVSQHKQETSPYVPELPSLTENFQNISSQVAVHLRFSHGMVYLSIFFLYHIFLLLLNIKLHNYYVEKGYLLCAYGETLQ